MGGHLLVRPFVDGLLLSIKKKEKRNKKKKTKKKKKKTDEGILQLLSKDE